PDRGPDHKPGGPGGPGGNLAADSASAQAAILEAVLTFYDDFARQNSHRDDLKFEASKASRPVCEAHVGLNRPESAEKATAAFRRAVGLLEPLVRQNPNNAEWRAELATAYALAPPEAYPNNPEVPLNRALELSADNPWLAGTIHFRL